MRNPLKKMNKITPLNREGRYYHVKDPIHKFYCPLCGVERGFRYSYQLNLKHYAQVAILTILTTLSLSIWFEWKGLFSIFFYWAVFEFMVKSLHRKEIPCSDCGFDATWYKRDVRVARKMVEEYWKGRPPLKIYKA